MSAARDTLSAVEVRALVNVALDLADDLGAECAVAVVDAGGGLRGAERPAGVPAGDLERALEIARDVLGAPGRDELSGPAVAAVRLGPAGHPRGVVAAAGGPEGVALEACRAAARALGLRRAA